MKKTEAISCMKREMTNAMAKQSQTAVEVNPFWSEENQQLLARRVAEYKASPEKFKEHGLIEID